MSQRTVLIAVAVFALITGGSWIVQAATAESAPFTLGFVNLERVSKEYDGTKASQGQLDTFQQTLKKQLDDREDMRFLDDAERAQVTQLRTVATLTPDQKKQLDNLLASSKARDTQLRALQQNPNKNDTEKAEVDRLTKLSQKTDDDLEAMGPKLDQDLQTKAEELSQKLTATVSEAITTVAKEKNISVVMDKKAILSGGADITDDVMKQLTKK